ncbi:MAG: ABC transporter permease [Spirochaetota bacterium]
MNKTLRVGRMEFRRTAMNRAFVIMTIIGPFLILAIAGLPSLVASSQGVEEGTTVGVVVSDQQLQGAIGSALEGSPVSVRFSRSEAAFQEAVEAGDMQGYLVLPSDMGADRMVYRSESGTDILVAQLLEQTVGEIVISRRLAGAGLNPAEVRELTSRPRVDVRRIDSQEEDDADGGDVPTTIIAGIAFSLLIYMSVILYGQAIARSVVQEKTSKTVEIMLSSVRPRDLLFGKILGKVVAGVIQYGVYVVVGLLFIAFIAPLFDITVPGVITVGNLLYLVAFFLTGFLLYGAAYAAIGAAGEDETHVAQLGWPLLLFLIGSLVFASSIVLNPNSTMSVLLSLFPFTSPIVMMLRILVDPPAAWQILLCFALLLGTIGVVVALGSRIFRVGILMSGKRFGWKDIATWLKV